MDQQLRPIILSFGASKPMRSQANLEKSTLQFWSCPCTGHHLINHSNIPNLAPAVEKGQMERISSVIDENTYDTPCGSSSEEPTVKASISTCGNAKEIAPVMSDLKPKGSGHGPNRRSRKRKKHTNGRKASSCGRASDYISSIQHSTHPTSMRWHVCQNLIRQSEELRPTIDGHPNSAKGDNAPSHA